MSYKVFISFTNADKQLANALNTYINNEFTGKVKTYLSEVAMQPGQNWKEQIRKNLNESQAVICLLTPQSISKPWIYIEWSAFWMSDKQFYVLTTTEIKPEMLVNPMQDKNVCNIADIESFRRFIGHLSREAKQSFIPVQNAPVFIAQIKKILKSQAGDRYTKDCFFEELHHVNLPVRSIKESIRFYRDILLLKEIERPFKFEGAWFGLPNGQHLHLVEDKSLPNRSKYWKTRKIEPKKSHFALRVEPDRWKEIGDLMIFNGLKRQESPDPKVKINQIYTTDPDCNVIEINSLTADQQKLKFRKKRII